MRYYRVEWIHDFPDEPILMYHEMDDEYWETRKVELYRDGSAGFADADREYRTGLSYVQIPTVEVIAQDPQFKPSEVSGEEFEKVWQQALGS